MTIKTLILSLVIILTFSSCESKIDDIETISTDKKICLSFNINKGKDSPISYANQETEINNLNLLIYTSTDYKTYTLRKIANIKDSLSNGKYHFFTKLNEKAKYKFLVIANDNLSNIKIGSDYNSLTNTLLSKTFDDNTYTSELLKGGIPMIGKANNGESILLKEPYNYDIDLIRAVCKLVIKNENTSSLTIKSLQLLQIPSSSNILKSDEKTYDKKVVNSKLENYNANDSYYFFESNNIENIEKAPCLHITGIYSIKNSENEEKTSRAEYTIELIKDNKPIDLKRNHIYTISFTTESNRTLSNAKLIEYTESKKTRELTLDSNNQ